MKKGLVLDKVVLLGRTLQEYRHYFGLDLEKLRGQAILDVASGVSSSLVTFEARRCTYLDRLKEDHDLRQFQFEEVRTDFEFLVNSNSYLRVFPR